eukprot:CAMPEP_0202901828 /NCGR_PEP_ID=MMETSP1392-20130828/14860_1 /ASSEMBLY_ACC=CAM_ASM_000868 /TAXON_ID=225041 /ORGANISM="Chlamydomonas chlamydogama, Strain SAG 11-48b" /LENGTH=115 /DNA_ID=CAMNT_0049588455 /DNA_START=732 /DNA_END=1079 /DNA_ORIENTATION=+
MSAGAARAHPRHTDPLVAEEAGTAVAACTTREVVVASALAGHALAAVALRVAAACLVGVQGGEADSETAWPRLWHAVGSSLAQLVIRLAIVSTSHSVAVPAAHGPHADGEGRRHG